MINTMNFRTMNFRTLAVMSILSIATFLSSTNDASAQAGEWIFCANEGQVCNVGGPADVTYGAQGTFVPPVFVRGSILCSYTTFGDPLPGVPKACFYMSRRPGGGPGGGSGGGAKIRIDSATYGYNVRARFNNALADVSNQCNGLKRCNYAISVRQLGDPAPGQMKDFRVEYSCGRVRQTSVRITPEANGQSFFLACR